MKMTGSACMAVVLAVLALDHGAVLRGQAVQLSPEQEMNMKAYVDLLRKDIKAGKVSIITEMMQFSPEEASTFWPTYRQYDAELTKLGDERVTLINDYALNLRTMTDAKADELVNKSVDLMERRLALQKRYYQVFRNKIGARKAAKFSQVENQLLLIIDLQIASSLPVFE